MDSKEKINEILDIAEKLQSECHATVREIIEKSDKSFSYQDVTNTWLFYQLAKITSDINDINRKITCLNVSKTLDLCDLENRLNDALEKETKESLTQWLEQQRKI